MRICAGITHVVIGEAPDMSYVVEEVRHRWNSLSIDTSRREDLAKTHPLGCDRKPRSQVFLPKKNQNRHTQVAYNKTGDRTVIGSYFLRFI